MCPRPASILRHALIGVALFVSAPCLADPERPESAWLMYLLQYIGGDYGVAVDEGRIASDVEYREMLDFSAILVENADVLRAHGAAESIDGELAALRRMIQDLAPADRVRDRAERLVARLFETLDEVARPRAVPDLNRGARLYAEDCAACHGARGAGDGFAAVGLDPPATPFRGERMNFISPHQIYGAVEFGIPATAMPSWRGARPSAELWDLAFYVLTLRDDFDPAPPAGAARVSLAELARYSNAQLARGALTAGNVDHLRQDPPVESDPALRAAVQLQDAFARIAERVFPSVVTVSSYVRDPEWTEQAMRGRDEAWRRAHGDELLYPGFRKLHSGSGFFVDDDGHALTCRHVLLNAEGELAEVVDVELDDGRHILSTIVGAEPTLNLALVKLAVFSEVRPPQVRPATLGDSDAIRRGHWAIALGNPPGPETTYAVGTLSAQPERQCYQGQLSATLMTAALRVPEESYGGPLVNIHGEVVGMTTPGGSPASASALPVNLARNVFETLKTTGSRRSPWLGFSVLELPSARRRLEDSGRSVRLSRTGVYIDDVFDPSPAGRAGILVGDCLVAMDSRRLFSVLDFQKGLYLAGIGRKVALQVFRDGETLEIEVPVEARPTAAAQ